MSYFPAPKHIYYLTETKKNILHLFPPCLAKVITTCAWLSRLQLFATPWAVARQATLSKEFFRQEHWSGLPFPTAGNLCNPGINLHLLHWQTDSLSLHHLGSHGHHHLSIISFNKIHVCGKV